MVKGDLDSFYIYNYGNQVTKFDCEGKEIDFITVNIVSGDEVVTAYFTDNTFKKLDSSKERMLDYYDGSYVVKHKDLLDWVNYISHGYTMSYSRLKAFGNIDRTWL